MPPESGTDRPWVNAVGGLGDTLMLAGVLKHVVDRDPERRFNLIARTKYPPLLAGHPAIAHIGHPPVGASIQPTDYWRHESFGPPDQRAYQVLARMFDLAPPVPESLFVPFPLTVDDPILEGLIPWQQRNVLLSSTSDSPRKELSVHLWEEVAARLRAQGVGVVQVGRRHDPYVRGCFSLLGLTTPRQLIGLLGRFEAAVTCDNFIMHAAHLCGVPAVVLWGPTDHRVYGYSGQIHLQAPPCADAHLCIAPANSEVYSTPCPKDECHCVDALGPDAIERAVLDELGRREVR